MRNRRVGDLSDFFAAASENISGSKGMVPYREPFQGFGGGGGGGGGMAEKLSQMSITPRVAMDSSPGLDAVSSVMRRYQCTFQDAIDAIVAGQVNVTHDRPQRWSDGYGGDLQNYRGVGFVEPLGLGNATCGALAAGVPGTVTLSVNAQKRMKAERLIVAASTTATTQNAHIFVTSVTIGGRTFANGNNPIPLSTFVAVDSLSNFAGALVETSQTVSVSFANYGADPVLVSGSLTGSTRE